VHDGTRVPLNGQSGRLAAVECAAEQSTLKGRRLPSWGLSAVTRCSEERTRNDRHTLRVGPVPFAPSAYSAVENPLRFLDSRLRRNDTPGKAACAGLELAEEAEVVFGEGAAVGDVVLAHGASFDAETERKNHGATEDAERDPSDTD